MGKALEAKPIISTQTTTYILDSNVLIHDPNSILNFEEHRVLIPMTVLEELDKLKNGKQTIAADCRQAIRIIDQILGSASPAEIESGVAITRGEKAAPLGTLSILSHQEADNVTTLPTSNNDNKIINDICQYQRNHPDTEVVLVTKDINMRLKSRGCGIHSEDYHSDQLLSDIGMLTNGYLHFEGNFWDRVNEVNTQQVEGATYHRIPRDTFSEDLYLNQFFLDDTGFVARVHSLTDDEVQLLHMSHENLMNQEAWGLQPLDIYQAMALNLLLDPDTHLVNLTGAAGSGKTILALAAAIEMTVATKQFRRIIATRSTRGLDEDIGYLPGTEAEKMEPWLGAITDNLEALHYDDESTNGSVDYILKQVPLHFKSLNYIRGRSFQQSLIIIDECQNLTPHQIKTIITRAGAGSKVICLGNLAQIDTPYLAPTSSGLTYMTERLKNFPHGGALQLKGVPRSPLAAYAEEYL
ncbi:ATPase [Endozoicomonas montiporae]|uniref:ATPase n=2 Tax=Endozoicomonas montiporae TaxID=1027273 RepID=A0A081N2Q9_9GAMM|nr:PhoH family protein [Endozoicomonas montiporae]AMO57996.1 phosphate starvation-inducible protein PhoH-related proteins [Endozoicomonas montiporae CL-33]KEQ12732.1 ATPase [Endozoicomonas montiporae]